MILGLIEIILVIGCFQLSTQADDWKTPAVLYTFGSVVLFFLDGDMGSGDVVQLVSSCFLAFGIFYLLERLEGLAWLCAVALGAALLIVL
jgi:hypothetical protein